MSGAKQNKTVLSRVRKTKRGSLLILGKGRGHFNAKHSRSKKLSQKRLRNLTISKKMRQQYNLA